MFRADMYPVIIVESRYGGTYESGRWHAIPRYWFDKTRQEMSDDEWGYYCYLHGDDCDAIDFWQSDFAIKKIGVGMTPDEALNDMYQKQSIPETIPTYLD